MKSCAHCWSIVLLVPLLVHAPAMSQKLPTLGLSPGEPLWVVANLFKASGFTQKNQYLCCEQETEKNSPTTWGEAIPAQVKREYLTLFQDQEEAVIQAVFTYENSMVDYYVYLRRSDSWKVQAVRTFAGSGIIRNLVEQLEKLSTQQRNRFFVQIPGEDYQFTLNNARLIISSDRQLIDYLQQKKSSFIQLLKEAKSVEAKLSYIQNQTSIFSEKIHRQRLKLALQDVELRRHFPGCYFFIVGRTADDTVGYIFTQNPQVLPKIDKDLFIVVRAIGGGWYLFKTT
ncbi:hypothetical protein [Anthocerotibacter panamensis]|uniref:hypothetical protein n=1 Tax=Anthocerotibacter panamensis TaxID=2857077 RepID=UPI001C407860|nr:hypothetical protein [Anthocerotibacter panamensis]